VLSGATYSEISFGDSFQAMSAGLATMHVFWVLPITANVNDATGNSATQASVNAWYDAVAPTTTISGIDIADDTGSSNSDFITNDASQVITATLSAALATGETLQISVNAGTTWSDDDHNTAGGTAVVTADVTLTSGTSSMPMLVVIRITVTSTSRALGFIGGAGFSESSTASTGGSRVNSSCMAKPMVAESATTRAKRNTRRACSSMVSRRRTSSS